MRCSQCPGKTRVVATEHREDGTHRWLRCLQCDALTRTVERFLNPKPGPKPGTPRSGPRALGSRNGASVLTESDVVRLRDLASLGYLQKELAKQYGIAPTTVSNIVTRKAWAHVK